MSWGPSNDDEGHRSSTLFSFEGRIARGQYWGTIAANFGVSFLTLVFIGQTVGGTNLEVNGLLFGALAVGGPMAWIQIAAYVKRWHDLGKSAWFALTLLIPLINVLIILYLGFAPGQKGSNAYGPST